MPDRQLPLTMDELLEAFGTAEVFNMLSFLDSQSGEIVTVAADVLEYCRGGHDGIDLQLSDSHDLPLAQAIAEETASLERGHDDEGLPFTPEDRRFFPVPRLGLPDGTGLRQAIQEWLDAHGLDVRD